MGHTKKSRVLVGILKDMTSIIKANLSTKRSKAKIHIAVLRATAHGVPVPPSDKRVTSVLCFGLGSRVTASTCIGALMDRLHGTKDACVALKCLFTIHSIITKGSFILKDQLSIYPSFGGRNFLNLSQFRRDSDPESWELSSWVRWYAAVIEQNLMVSRLLGYYLCSDADKNLKEEIVQVLLSKDLVREIEVLVDYVERICEAPESLHLQRNILVYEVVRLVSEDNRLVQREICLRVKELRDRLPSLGPDELAQIVCVLQKLEGCKERLFMLFVNRSRNDEMWELIKETKINIIETMKIESKALVKLGSTDGCGEFNRFREQFVIESGNLGRFRADNKWSAMDLVPLTVKTAV
ncbi:hypothetical protein K2173_011414 [Erythroxylum novogranatense]|uniref:ENTH domain-containing protein n=1 Tax=Erythroxylum novogranatense TaxID=1862640 RepID=A0AAV8S7H8_9ROSI|nr:hypothetical protein K2173_011414 [Erythroxylum novogranatense]